MTIACVSPRVKSAEPCTDGGSGDIRIVMGRTSVVDRPSWRTPVEWTRRRIPAEHRALNAAFTSASAKVFESPASAAPSAVHSERRTSRCTSRRRASLSFFSSPESIACTFASTPHVSRAAPRSAGGASTPSRNGGWPTSAFHFAIALAIVATAARPFSNASTTRASGRKSAKPSIISPASAVPATTRSSLPPPAATSAFVGLTTSSSPTRTTRTAATGLAKGTCETASAADAEQIAITSGRCSPSAARTYEVSCVSSDQPLPRSGRSGRSISRQTSVSWSEGRPSRLMYPPAVRPTLDLRSM